MSERAPVCVRVCVCVCVSVCLCMTTHINMGPLLSVHAGNHSVDNQTAKSDTANSNLLFFTLLQ